MFQGGVSVQLVSVHFTVLMFLLSSEHQRNNVCHGDQLGVLQQRVVQWVSNWSRWRVWCLRPVSRSLELLDLFFFSFARLTFHAESISCDFISSNWSRRFAVKLPVSSWGSVLHSCCTFFLSCVSAVGIYVNSSSAALKRTFKIWFVTEFLWGGVPLQLSGDVCVLSVCTACV